MNITKEYQPFSILQRRAFAVKRRTPPQVLNLCVMDRLEQHLGFPPTMGLANTMFSRGRQVKAEEMFLLGYRPSYSRRMSAGVKTWYFLFRVFGQELVAVLSEDGDENAYVWVTTYAPTQLRLAAA